MYSEKSKKMPVYRSVDDISAYIQELKAAGADAFTAEKFARIAARKGTIGEVVISWSVDGDGAPLLEKKAQVTADAQTGETDWVVTKVGEDGLAMIDQNGNKNEWIVDDKTFRRKYNEDTARPGIYKPVGGPQKFIKLSEAVTVHQWGNEMNVDAGGYVNVTNPNDIYVISGRDFEDTYRVMDEL